jgi:hypothetical protein
MSINSDGDAGVGWFGTFLAGHHPQQSVLYRQTGHRHTACIRNISAPHRSQITLSSADARRSVGAGTGAAAGLLGSGMARL